jgi:hypothetical protein
VRIFAILILVLASDMAAAQQKTFRNSMGQTTGRSVTNGNQTTFYDNMGRNTGRGVTNNAGTTIYDNKGRQTGSIK